VDSNAPDSSFSFKDIPRAINNIPPGGWSWGEKEEEKYQEQQDRLAELRRQATDTVSYSLAQDEEMYTYVVKMSDVTEATLESILSGAEALKAVSPADKL
jgi:hypothetical protein